MAAVPAKDLETAKQRLIAVLSDAERRALARTMLEDVLDTLAAARLDSVLVVTSDPEVTALAQQFPVAILEEGEPQGHSEAVALAQRVAVHRGAHRLLTVPGDVPQIAPEEVAALLAATPPAPAVVFVPSRSGLGTNGVLLSPPNLMELKFGEPSFANHLTAARQRGLEPRVLHLPGLGLDVDGPEDLQALLTSERSTRSSALIRALGIASRLGT
ncbi:MAG: 2-phospho-L-lactate guanylyltransferase [Candidatus Methylomirabilia bacterium]